MVTELAAYEMAQRSTFSGEILLKHIFKIHLLLPTNTTSFHYKHNS